MTPSAYSEQPEPVAGAGPSAPQQGNNPPPPEGVATPQGRRRWRPGLILAVVAGAAAAGTTWFLLPTPQATVRTTLRLGRGNFLGEPVKNPESFQRTQVALVRSRLVLNVVLRDPGVAKLPLVKGQVEPVEWLEREVQADFSVAPEVLRIWMEGHDPAQLVPIVNAVREAYRKEVVDKESSARRARLDWLAQQREGFEAKLREAGELRRAAERGAGGKDAVLRARVLTFMQEYVSLTEKQLLKTNSDLRDAKMELQLLEAAEKDPAGLAIPEGDVEKALPQDKEVVELEKEVARLETLLMEALGDLVLKERDPDVQRLRRQLTAAKARLSARKLALRKSVIEKLREQARANLAGKLAALRGRITHLTGTEALLQKELQVLQKELAAKTERGIKLDEIQEDLGRVEEWAKRLGDEEEKLKLELQAPSGVSVLEEGVVSRVNVTSAQLVRAGLACLAGLAGFVLFGFTWVVLRFLVSVL